MIILRGKEEKEDARNVPALIAIFTLDYFVWTTAESSMSCEITNDDMMMMSYVLCHVSWSMYNLCGRMVE